MTVSPLPRQGDVLLGRDVDGRWLRVSGHPETGRVVLSIWQGDICRATFRLAPEDGRSARPSASDGLTDAG